MRLALFALLLAAAVLAIYFAARSCKPGDRGIVIGGVLLAGCRP